VFYVRECVAVVWLFSLVFFFFVMTGMCYFNCSTDVRVYPVWLIWGQLTEMQSAVAFTFAFLFPPSIRLRRALLSVFFFSWFLL
jgi:hypothetical protein